MLYLDLHKEKEADNSLSSRLLSKASYPAAQQTSQISKFVPKPTVSLHQASKVES